MNLDQMIAEAQIREAKRNEDAIRVQADKLTAHANERCAHLSNQIALYFNEELASLFTIFYEHDKSYQGNAYAVMIHQGATFRLRQSFRLDINRWFVYRIIPKADHVTEFATPNYTPNDENIDRLLWALGEQLAAPDAILLPDGE